MENWKDIKGYEGFYQVSDAGRVKSLRRWINNKGNGGYFLEGKIVNTSISKGYPTVGLSKDGKGKNIRIHQLVAMSFLGHTPCGHKLVVDHIDNNPLNNNVENLQLITNRENLSKDKKGGTSKYVGVFYSGKGINKWKASTSVYGKVIGLGSFDSELRASIAYNFALAQLDKLKEYNLTR